MSWQLKLQNKINNKFQTNSDPVCFGISGSDKLIISGETGCEDPVIDYYGEFTGGYPWVNPKLEKILKGYQWDWAGPGSLEIYGPE